MTRQGPHPLPLHIGMAMAPRSPELCAQFQYPVPMTQDELAEMLRGIRLYQDHPCKARRAPMKTIWQSGATRLLCAQKKRRKKNEKTTPLVLIPSLINKADIFDLSKERSIYHWLEGQGIVCYLLDWGDFIKEKEQDIDIEYLIHQRLIPALRAVSEMEGRSIDCLGYCMGGTLLMAVQNRLKDIIRKTVLLAAPWDFHAPEMHLTNHVGVWMPAAMPMMHERGYLPSHWMQGLFATLDPEGSARKFIRFASLDQDSEAARLFVYVEDWLNDGVDLPGKLVHHCLQEWFIRNAPLKGTWRIENETIDLKKTTGKILIVASKRDRLVPLSSAGALKAQMPKATIDVLDVSCGHIGFIAGQNSMHDVWNPIAAWLQADDFAAAV
jgi:polyhydroxyalkanoate synthase subunit PhaC